MTTVAKALIALSKHTSERPGPVEGKPNGRLFSTYGAGCDLPTIDDLKSWLDAKLSRTNQTLECFTQKLVMCHMDISLRNIIKDTSGSIWILDWAYAGYYPQEFEVSPLRTNKTDGDFSLDFI